MGEINRLEKVELDARLAAGERERYRLILPEAVVGEVELQRTRHTRRGLRRILGTLETAVMGEQRLDTESD